MVLTFFDQQGVFFHQLCAVLGITFNATYIVKVLGIGHLFEAGEAEKGDGSSGQCVASVLVNTASVVCQELVKHNIQVLP
jgi:hypothetical protein